MNTDPLKDILALDVVKTELEVDSMLLKRSELSDGLELKISEFQSAILLKVREDNKNPDCMSKLIVIFNPDNVYFDFGSYNGKKGIGINLSFASQRDIERANTHPKTKTFSQLNNIDLYDCYAMTSYEFDNNLLEKLSSDVLPLSQFIDVLKYFAVNFETKGDLIQMIKGFYIEYAAHLNEINDVEIAISRMEYQIKLYYKNFYSKEFVDGQYIKTGNVIVVHFKKKDFTTFIAYVIKKATEINVVIDTEKLAGCQISYEYIDNPETDNAKRYFTKLGRSNMGTTLRRNDLMHSLVNHKINEDKIDIYTIEEYNDYLMLINTESDNIKKSKEGYYFELSKKYEELYGKR